MPLSGGFLSKPYYKKVVTFNPETADVNTIYNETSTGKIYTHDGVSWTAIQDEFNTALNSFNNVVAYVGENTTVQNIASGNNVDIIVENSTAYSAYIVEIEGYSGDTYNALTATINGTAFPITISRETDYTKRIVINEELTGNVTVNIENTDADYDYIKAVRVYGVISVI